MRYQQHAQLGSEADPCITSGFGLCLTSGTSLGASCSIVSVLCIEQMHTACGCLVSSPSVCAMCAWESTLDLELTPKPLISSSSPCRPSSLFLFLFCCRSNSSWIFFVLPERYLPPFSCVICPSPGSSVQQPALYYLPSLCSPSSALPIVTCALVSPCSHQSRLRAGARMGRTCTNHWDCMLLAHRPFSAVPTQPWEPETWLLAGAQVLPSFSTKTLRT